MEKLALRVDAAAAAIDISRSKAYELINAGQLPAIRIGHSWRVPVAALTNWINNDRAAVATNNDGSEVGTDDESSRPVRDRA